MPSGYVNATLIPSISIFSGSMFPAEGPRVIPIYLNFQLADSYALDYRNQQALGLMSMCQALYIDNSDSVVPIVVKNEGTGQSIIVSGRTQGYYTIPCPNPIRLTFSAPGGAEKAQVLLLNYPVTSAQWSATAV